jgi:hypothetical protein
VLAGAREHRRRVDFPCCGLEVGGKWSLLTLAGVTSRESHRLLDGAEVVLGLAASDPAGTPRGAVFHAGWLARAHVAADDLDRVEIECYEA